METLFLGIIFVAVCGIAIVLWQMLPILLIATAIGLIVFAILYFAMMKRYENAVVETEIIKIEPIIEKQAENTGYTVGYGKRLSYHEHYRYRDVKTGDRVTFRVTWNDGSVNTITCKKSDGTYKRLYSKLKK